MNATNQQEYIRKLKKYSAQLNEMIEDGSFYRLSFFERVRLVRRVKKLYNRLLGSFSAVKLQHVMAAAAVVVLGTGCPLPTAEPGLNLRSGASDQVQPGSQSSAPPVPGTNPTFTTAPEFQPFGLNWTPFTNVSYGSYYQLNLYYLQGIAFTDLDGDGDLDAIESRQTHYYGYYINGFGKHELLYRENTGTRESPQFGDSQPLPLQGNLQGSGDLAMADLDGDGDEDILIGATETGGYYLGYTVGLNGIIYVENTSSGSGLEFTAHPPLREDAVDLRDVDLGDIDSDGDYDLLVGRYGALNLYENTGSGEVAEFDFNQPEEIYSNGGGYHHFGIFVDTDGDGDLDILGAVGYGYAYGNYADAYGFGILPNQGDVVNKSFGARLPLTVTSPSYAAFAQLVDLDSDGDLDIVGTGYRYYYNGSAGFWENTDID